MKTLVIDTATAACSIALIEDGRLIACAHDVVGRGHAEQLVPMIAALPGGGRADTILVDVGPGSFTGIRVGIAAARGLALGWSVPVAGYSAMALLAATGFADGMDDAAGALAVVIEGGHGEVFMQGFAASPFAATDALVSLAPAEAHMTLAGRIAIGSGVRRLGLDNAHATLPDAARAILLPPAFAALPPRPLYGRAPDAKLPG